MNTTEIIRTIDAELARLSQAKALLSATTTAKGRGRRVGSAIKPKGRTPRKISSEGKARIAAAQKARWAKLKRS